MMSTFQNGAGNTSVVAHVDKYFKLDCPIHYAVATGTGVIADIQENNIFLMYGSEIGRTAFAGVSRVRFLDF